ncbi:MAG: 50S ribosomal protein L3 [Candidatus Norongarragalinales archaeon]
MGKRGPLRGSRAFWHRARARRIAPRVRAWAAPNAAGGGLQAFPGFKAGMTRVLMIDDSESLTKGQEISRAVTIVETPPVFVYSVVFYEQTPFGLKRMGEVVAPNAPKQARRVKPSAKKTKRIIEDFEKRASEIACVRVLLCTQPWKAGVGNKTPQFFECAVGGKTPAEQLAAAAALLGKEVRVNDVFKEGALADAIAVTKGYGWQGVVRRFGVSLGPRKASKARRHGGAIGAERQAKVSYRVPRAGQTGFHRRTERAKRIMRIMHDSKEVSETGAIAHYGALRGDYLLVEGSLPGPSKRLVVLRKPLRHFPEKKPDIKLIVKQKA